MAKITFRKINLFVRIEYCKYNELKIIIVFAVVHSLAGQQAKTGQEKETSRSATLTLVGDTTHLIKRHLLDLQASTFVKSDAIEVKLAAGSSIDSSTLPLSSLRILHHCSPSDATNPSSY